MRKGSIHLLWCERNGQTLLLVVEMKAFENIRVHNFNDLSLPMLLLVILDWKLFWKSSDTRSQAVLMIPRTWPFLLITSDNLCILISFATLFELNTLDGHIRLSFPKKTWFNSHSRANSTSNLTLSNIYEDRGIFRWETKFTMSNVYPISGVFH